MSWDLDRVRIDPTAHQAWLGDRRLDLTRKEFHLLRTLVRHPGKVVAHEMLLQEIWQSEGSMKTLYAHIEELRRKLGDDAKQPRYILAVWGIGYRIARGAVNPPITLPRPEPPGSLLAADGKPILVVDGDLVVMWPGGANENPMGPRIARDLAAHLAALAEEAEASQ